MLVIEEYPGTRLCTKSRRAQAAFELSLGDSVEGDNGVTEQPLLAGCKVDMRYLL